MKINGESIKDRKLFPKVRRKRIRPIRETLHIKLCKEVAELVNGVLVKSGTKLDSYNPDIISSDGTHMICYEIENYLKLDKRLLRKKFGHLSEKKVLVMCHSESLDLFDEVYIYYKKRLVEIRLD